MPRAGDQTQPKLKPYTVYASLLFDSKTRSFLANIALTISPSSGRIVSVKSYDPSASPSLEIRSPDLDFRGKTVLPGLVDAHTHILLHPYTETPALNQIRDESLVQRIVQATNNCRLALKAGYTTYRDLGTEGAYNVDIGIRDSINRGMIPGPRLFVATEALASSDSYQLRQENRIGGMIAPRLSDECDGPQGVKSAVRRRIGAGADVIKFYGEYRRRTLRFPAQSWSGASPIIVPPFCGPSRSVDRSDFQNLAHETELGEASTPDTASDSDDQVDFMDYRNPNAIMFDQEEMAAIVAECRRAKAPVACHASTPEAVIMASNAGVTTVEHGYVSSFQALETMNKNGTIFVPTLSVYELELRAMGGGRIWKSIKQHTKNAFDQGVALACGGDTGAFAHGDNVRELELFMESGIPLVDTLRAATLGGWEACGKELSGFKFGWLGEGWSADMTVLDGDLREDITVLRKVETVIKDGRVVVWEAEVIEKV
ncbi:hypothetical protein IAR55_003544 [Kwoniella newhampshirensis]|uniref:Amidohydrolase-related domain-containing protein n=1 Tax=Kwoniella newhampshirensis TaxID=1651941 RepID=A0AAW0YMS0_9TREE